MLFPPPFVHLPDIPSDPHKIVDERQSQRRHDNRRHTREDPSSSFGLMECEMDGEEDFGEEEEDERDEGEGGEKQWERDEGSVEGLRRRR